MKKTTFLLLSLLAVEPLCAGIYKWVDDTGRIHFSDKNSVGAEAQRVELKINTYESVSYDTSVLDTGDKVVMYSASWCGHCKRARKYFQSNNIAFTEYDIEKSTKAKRDYKKLGARGVPVILVGKKRMNGFSVAGFKRIYQ